ncbi:MAG TPA: thioesterase domain-containing protein [Pseudonocardiaceae bacterium]
MPTETRPIWFMNSLSDTATARLFCFPYSGCGATMYQAWPRWIGGIEVVPVQLPGRENRMREPHFGTYEQLAATLVEGLRPFLDRPYALFGHCGGALPAAETVLRLATAGLPAPARLYVSSQVAPQDGPYGRYLGLTRDELSGELGALMRAAGGEPDPEILDVLLDVLVEDVDANRRYRKDVAPRFGCPLTAVGWTRDVEIPPALMTGWADCGPTRDVLLEGEHYTFLDPPDALLAEFAAGLPG